MPYMLRVDAPDRIRRQYAAMPEGGYVVLAGAAWFMMATGTITLLIMAAGHSLIGVVVCLAWNLAWFHVRRSVAHRRRALVAWLQPVQIGQSYIKDAHEAYQRLSPEGQATYGLPLIERLYQLSVLDVRGGAGRDRIENAMRDRWLALEALVDAEDALRLYAADPVLADCDDVNAARAWERAVEAVERGIRAADI